MSKAKKGLILSVLAIISSCVLIGHDLVLMSESKPTSIFTSLGLMIGGVILFFTCRRNVIKEKNQDKTTL